MSSKKTFSQKQLESLSASEIIQKIQSENFSLLKTLGGEKLRKEMVPVGKICALVVKICPTPKKLAKGLRKFTPANYETKNLPKNSKNGLVIGFNHPSLGEIPRLILMKLEQFDEKPMLFPVNLPWYEAIAPIHESLKKLGILITPTITPSTWKKLALVPKNPLYEPAEKLKRDFRNLYTDLSIETVKDGGCIMVAPSATRQATVFRTKAVYEKTEEVIPTMSVLALKLYQNPETSSAFLPVAVFPLENASRGLNLFKTYTLIPGKLMTAAEIRQNYFKTANPKRLENFDYDFHQRIAAELPKKFWF